MSMRYIRQTYGVPAKRGMTILFRGKPHRILSGNIMLRVRDLETGSRYSIHPTWEVEYPDPDQPGRCGEVER